MRSESPPLISREILFGNPEKTSPRLSPDGQRLAYLAPDDKDVLNVWVGTVGKDDHQVVTSDRKRGIRFFTWQWDGQHVLYLQDREGDENWHLYQTNLETGTTRDLTPFEKIQAQTIAYDSNFPDQLLVGLTLRDESLHDVYRLNLTTGELELEVQNPGDVSNWTADHELQIRAAHGLTPDGGAFTRVRDDRRSPWRELLRWGPDETFGGVRGFSPDNTRLWVISSVNANAARLLEVDVGSGDFRVLAEDPTYDVAGLMTHPKTHELEAVRFVRERSQWMLVDSRLTSDFEEIPQLSPGDFSVVSRDLKDRTWLLSFVNDEAPVCYYTLDRVSRKATFLFSSRPQLGQYHLAPMRPISLESRDGMTLYGYLTLPLGCQPKHLPLVLNVHGGPWTRNVWGLDNETQWLANRGYAVLQINYRGSTGYGKDYLNAGDREWGAKMHDDLIDGKNWAVGEGYADADRVAIYGGSFGGYAALVGLTFTPDEFACAVDIVGPSNLATLIRSIPPYWAPLRSVFDKRVGKVECEEEFLKSRSPLFKSDRIRKPLLIAQGANDPRVKQSESDQIVAEMRKNNRPVEYLVFPDEGHGFARPENRLKFYAAAERFLAEHLQGRVEPPREEEKWNQLKQ
jgi:dipeptidyl aminopeptidase/acylaminoacyl peptidase